MSSFRTGFSTGTCAAGAAKAAAMLLCGHPLGDEIDVGLPDGTRARLRLARAGGGPQGAEAAVYKDAGDDPDVTQGALVVASVSWTNGTELSLVAGDGVGTVTKPGLASPPGAPAINPVPRAMIGAAIREVTPAGLRVVLSIPGGRELAARTFNPRLGVVGGLSILGTTGRVRPFSAPALREALRCAIDVAKACGVTSPVLVPGNIGARAARRLLRLSDEQVIEVSNEWGYMLDRAAEAGFSQVLVLGHGGKLAKLAEAQWDTHSSRSSSAAPAVRELGEKLLGHPLSPSETVEGIFASLSPHERRRLADELASRITASLRGRTGNIAGTVLVDLQGELLGSHGDISPWN